MDVKWESRRFSYICFSKFWFTVLILLVAGSVFEDLSVLGHSESFSK